MNCIQSVPTSSRRKRYTSSGNAPFIGVHGRQHVVLDLVLLEEAQAPHDLVERALTPLVDPVDVMEWLRPVDADANEVVVLLQELAPLVREQRAVRLNGVLERHPRLAVPLLDLDRSAEEVKAHQCRLAALPRDRHHRRGVGVDQLPDVALEHLVRHVETTAFVQLLLVQEEAVRTAEVADRAGRLRQHVERFRRPGALQKSGRISAVLDGRPWEIGIGGHRIEPICRDVSVSVAASSVNVPPCGSATRSPPAGLRQSGRPDRATSSAG